MKWKKDKRKKVFLNWRQGATPKGGSLPVTIKFNL